jgi:hypothetical protein
MKKIRSLAIASLFVLSVAAAHATTFTENFTNDPSADGWQVFGDTNLFQWDSTNKNLNVTWDSSQPNAYFYHPLGATYTQADGFCVLFDLQLNDANAAGFGNELAAGLLHFSDATNSGFMRSSGTLPNVCEFDYFAPDEAGDPASDDATLVDANANFYFAFDNLTLNPGVTYHVVLIHQPGATGISGRIFTNGQAMTSLPFTFADFPATNDTGAFQVDTLAVSSYADDGFGDSLLAHGTMSRFAFASPLPVGLINTPAAGQVQFTSDTNWLYTLEQTADFQTWTAAAPATFGNGTNLILQDTNPPADKTFYRVRADLP